MNQDDAASTYEIERRLDDAVAKARARVAPEPDERLNAVAFEIAFVTFLSGLVMAYPTDGYVYYGLLKGLVGLIGGLTVVRWIAVLEGVPYSHQFMQSSKGVIVYTSGLSIVYLGARGVMQLIQYGWIGADFGEVFVLFAVVLSVVYVYAKIKIHKTIQMFLAKEHRRTGGLRNRVVSTIILIALTGLGLFVWNGSLVDTTTILVILISPTWLASHLYSSYGLDEDSFGMSTPVRAIILFISAYLAFRLSYGLPL